MAKNSSSAAPNSKWKVILGYHGVPPYANVKLISNGKFDWRITGSGIPFRLSGKNTSFKHQWVGWAGTVLVVQVRAPKGTTVRAVFTGYGTVEELESF